LRAGRDLRVDWACGNTRRKEDPLPRSAGVKSTGETNDLFFPMGSETQLFGLEKFHIELSTIRLLA
jgi:hypothetical protein